MALVHPNGCGDQGGRAVKGARQKLVQVQISAGENNLQIKKFNEMKIKIKQMKI